jgi:glycosyltransferase involved in cell wall biosynthesis
VLRHRLLFISHFDWKFARALVAEFAARPDVEVRTLELSNLHDDRIGPPRNDRRVAPQTEARLARDAMAWADTVFVEWCDGNAAWVSRHIPRAKRLIIRLHSSEIGTAWPAQVAWENVDAIIFVADHVRERAAAELALARYPRLRIETIGNLRDLERFDRPKRAGADRRLGLIGWYRVVKQPMLALEIVERLRAEDASWQLCLVGPPPDLGARLPTAEERARYDGKAAYYAAFYAALEQLGPHGPVSMRGWTDDVPSLLRDIGWILSCSSYEGTHEAVIEGMASGAIPVVRRWRGAAELHAGSLLFSDAEEAVAQIRAVAALDDGTRTRLRDALRRDARERFDGPTARGKLHDVVLDRTERGAIPRQRAIAS